MRSKLENLILIGGGGHCLSSIDVIEQERKFDIRGILDLAQNIDKHVLDYKVIGTDEDIMSHIENNYFIITIGQLKSVENRVNLFELLQRLSAKVATIISPFAYVSRHAQIGEGSIVMHGATVNAGAKIGRNCIINTGANIEHNVNIGDHCHISTHALVNGDCIIGSNTFVGSGAVISNQVSISNNTIIGALSLVLKDIRDEGGIYAGSPCKKIK